MYAHLKHKTKHYCLNSKCACVHTLLYQTHLKITLLAFCSCYNNIPKQNSTETQEIMKKTHTKKSQIQKPTCDLHVDCGEEDVHGCDGHPIGVLTVGGGTTDHVLKEHLQNGSM